MDEVIVSFIGTFTEGEITADHAVVSGLVKLNQIQTELFQSHKGDIFDQHVQTADDLVHFHGVNRLQASAGQDPLLWARCVQPAGAPMCWHTRAFAANLACVSVQDEAPRRTN